MVRWLVTCATEAGEELLLVALTYGNKSLKNVMLWFFCV